MNKPATLSSFCLIFSLAKQIDSNIIYSVEDGVKQYLCSRSISKLFLQVYAWKHSGHMAKEKKKICAPKILANNYMLVPEVVKCSVKSMYWSTLVRCVGMHMHIC